MRHFGDWVEAFVEHTEGIKSPTLFRKWAAISSVAAAIRRRAYSRIGTQRLYPNLFVLLIAYPGVGKSNAIKTARNLVRRINDIALTPTRLTPRAFYNEINSCVCKSPVNDTSLSRDGVYLHSSLTAMIDEFSVFVRPRASEFMSDLCDAYDCADPFEYKTATQGEINAPNSFFNMIGGATPSYLAESWTKTVLDEGFPARCIISYSEEGRRKKLFGKNDEEDEDIQIDGEGKLTEDIRTISELSGRFTWTDEAADAFEDWNEKDMPPKPADERLVHYCKRRDVHTAKLSMLMSVARRDDMEITLDDFEYGRRLLLETEKSMIKAIEPLGASPYRDAMVLVRRFVEGFVKRNGKGVPENRVRHILINEVDPIRINHVLAEMILARWLKFEGEPPGRVFFPGDADVA